MATNNAINIGVVAGGGFTYTFPSASVTLASLTGTETLTNKTLTTPIFATLGYIADANSNVMLQFQTVASSVNAVRLLNAATGTGPTVSASGADTNVDLLLVSKGTGLVKANGIGIVDLSTAQTLTNKTLTTPIISSISNTGTLTLPTSTDTLVGRATTDTLTNKRNQPRTASSTTASTITPDLSSANVYFRTTQTAGLTINAPTGTPVIGEVITIYVDAAGAQTLSMNATYIAFGAAFPASLTAGKTFMLTAMYNGTNWKCTWANAI